MVGLISFRIFQKFYIQKVRVFLCGQREQLQEFFPQSVSWGLEGLNRTHKV